MKKPVSHHWIRWYFVASGSSGYTRSHCCTMSSDGKVRKLCDGHVLNDVQLRTAQTSYDKMCKPCGFKYTSRVSRVSRVSRKTR